MKRVASKEVKKVNEATSDINFHHTKAQVVPLTQENAADLHSFGTVATTVGGKHIDHVKNMSPCHFMTFFSLVAICLAFSSQQA
jgi:hypothetical protein